VGGPQKRGAEAEGSYEILRCRDRVSQICLPPRRRLATAVCSGTLSSARSLVHSGACAGVFSVVLAGGG
jgi:hypothetical protein